MIRKWVFFCIAGLIAQLVCASSWEDDCRYLIRALAVTPVPAGTAISEQMFKSMAIHDDVFRPVQIGGKKFDEPRTFGELLDYLAGIHNVLSDRAASEVEKEIIWQYADAKPIKLKLPAIGEGKHTVVYEMEDLDPEQCHAEDKKKVYKLTKPDVASLRATLKDIHSSHFWLTHQAEEFYVPRYIDYHRAGGLFRIAEKCDGISLTKMLLYLGVLSFDEQYEFGDDAAASAVLRAENQLLKSDPQYQKSLGKIKKGVMKIIRTVQNYPEHCTSLSPNNIYITFTQDSDGHVDKVQQVVLVDIGVSRDPWEKIKGYNLIRSFDDYLKLAKKSLNSYLKSDVYRYDFDDMRQWLVGGKRRFGELGCLHAK